MRRRSPSSPTRSPAAGMHHAWLLVGPEGVGKATLAYHFARMVARRGRWAARRAATASIPCSARSRRCRIPICFVIRRAWNDKTKRYSQWIGVDEVRRLRAFLGTYGGRGRLARGHRRPRRRAQPERGQRAAEGSGRAAAAHAVPADLERRGTASRHHPLAHAGRFASRLLAEDDLAKAVRRGARSRRARGRCQDACHRTRAEPRQRAARARARSRARASSSTARSLQAFATPCPSLTAGGCIARSSGSPSTAETERLELYLSLLLGLIERLIRVARDGRRARQRQGARARQATRIAGAISPHGPKPGRRSREAKAEALALNLDRSLLVLETWFRLQSGRARTSCLASERGALAGPARAEAIPSPPWRTSGPITSPPPSPIRTTRPISATPMRPIATDALARFRRLQGRDVFFLTGTDEHGIKMLQTAKDARHHRRPSLPTATRRTSATWSRALDCSNDDFIRTREERHKRACQELWRRMQATGDIYLGKYAGWYSVRDEAYYDESELKEAADGQQAVAARHAGRMGRGGELFLQAVGLSGKAACPLRGASRVHRTRHAGERGEELRARRPPGSLDLAHHLRLGHPRPGRSEAHHVCVGRCADQLSDRRRLSRRADPKASSAIGLPTCISSARTSSASTPSIGRPS